VGQDDAHGYCQLDQADVEFDYKIWTFLWPKTALNELFHSNSALSEFPLTPLMSPTDWKCKLID